MNEKILPRFTGLDLLGQKNWERQLDAEVLSLHFLNFRHLYVDSVTKRKLKSKKTAKSNVQCTHLERLLLTFTFSNQFSFLFLFFFLGISYLSFLAVSRT